ncbi:MAG: Ig-like domain-containing protein, partial [Gemmatimonadota bacterium]|nr:Ig-like domain-containing protein [Gemmatimonadota bacterium]
MFRPLVPLTLFSIFTLASCGGDDLVLPSEGQAAAIEIMEGNGQSGRVGETLQELLVVRVTDVADRPVFGATVAIELSGATAEPDTVVTDAEGFASSSLALGSAVGEATGEARVIVPEGQSPVAAGISLTALSSSANEISPVSGDEQQAPAGAELTEPLVVLVTDGFGNAVAGETIGWEAIGGGSVSEATTTTGADGRASVRRTLGPVAGAQSTSATAHGLAGSPVIFTHTATAGSAAGVRIISGDEQTGAAGSELAGDLVVEVDDEAGNPVTGAAVAWVASGGGGSLEPGTSNTDANGRASTRWTLGPSAGPNTAQAVVSGVGQATFHATATAGSASALSLSTQPSSSARVGVPFERQPIIQLQDASGNQVSQAGVAVIVAVNSGGGTLGGTTTRNTDAGGRATFTDLEINGATGEHRLIFAAPGYTSVASGAINVAAASTTTAITSDNSDPSQVDQPVVVAYTVSSAGGTPTGNVIVTASGGSETCTGSVADGECSITLSAPGERTLTASYQGDALFAASSDTEGHTVGPVPPPQPAATTTTITSDQPEPSEVNQKVTVGFTVTSAVGTPTGNVVVTASGGAETCSASAATGS